MNGVQTHNFSGDKNFEVVNPTTMWSQPRRTPSYHRKLSNDWNNWNIVESGVKHHKPNQTYDTYKVRRAQKLFQLKIEMKPKQWN
jgi:hypothetical protein